MKIQGGFECSFAQQADVLCHDETGNVVSQEYMAPVVYQFMLKAGGTGQAVHILAVKWMCSVIETGKKGFSWELVEKSSGVSIYVKGGGAPGTMEEQTHSHHQMRMY